MKSSLHNIIDSCYSTTGYMSNMFRICWAIIKLTKVSIKSKPDDGQIRPKHVADVTSCRITIVNFVV